MNTNTRESDSPITIDMDGPNGPRVVFPAGDFPAEDVDAAAPEGWVVSWGTSIADTSDGRRALPLVRPSLADAYRAAHAAMVAADALDDATPCTCDEREDSTCPGCDARIAYHAADRACDVARAAWLDSDEDRDCATGGDSWGGGTGDTIEGVAPSDIEAEIEDGARDGDWDTEGGTLWITDWAAPIDPVTGQAIESARVRVTTAIAPEAPACTSEDHDWRAPHAVVGGLAENPGVWGKGGGVIIREVCATCGVYRVTDTWAQDPSSGEQGLTSVRYEDADDDSEAWVASLAPADEGEGEGEGEA